MIYLPGINLLCLNIAMFAFFKRLKRAVDVFDLYDNWYDSLPIVGHYFASIDDTASYLVDQEQINIVNTIINVFGVLPSLWQCPFFNPLLSISILWNLFMLLLLFLGFAELLFTLCLTTIPLEPYGICALGGFTWCALHLILIMDMMELQSILECTGELTKNNDQDDSDDEDIYGDINAQIGMLEDGAAN